MTSSAKMTLRSFLAGCLLLALVMAPAAEAAPVHTTLLTSRHFWNHQRLSSAVPMPLDGTSPVGDDQESQITRLADGVDTGPTVAPPNTINGAIFGDYLIDGKDHYYECSGSVISTPVEDVVLTAGHCVIDPETGTATSKLVFIPDYREQTTPLGIWPVGQSIVSKVWAQSIKMKSPNEAADVAFLKVPPNENGQSLQSVTSSFDIAFGTRRNQPYTQYGYPAEEPYDGEHLYRYTTGYAQPDLAFDPETLGIISDFTPGASGGPWLAKNRVVSVNAYKYTKPAILNKYMYGPYFGTLVAGLFQAAGGYDGIAVDKSVALQRSHASSNGTAKIKVKVGSAGYLQLKSPSLRVSDHWFQKAGAVSLQLTPTNSLRRRLQDQGRLRVPYTLSFNPDNGGLHNVHKSVTLRLHTRR